MLHTISFLKIVATGISSSNASRVVDDLQSYYYCPADWHLDLKITPTNNTVGFLCSGEFSDTDNLKSFVEDQLIEMNHYKLDVINGNVNVVFEL